MKRSLLLLLVPVLLVGALAVPASAWGGGWSITPSPNPRVPTGQLFWVSCPAADSCMAVGTYVKPSGAGVTLAEQWNGRSWRILPTPSPSGMASSNLLGVVCTSTSACIAVGAGVSTTGASQAVVEQWNGTRWRIQPTPNLSHGSALNGVSCTSASACTAVGRSGSGPLAERWNGTRWSIQATPNPPEGNGFLSGVACTSATACIAAGASNPFTSSAKTLAERWNGTRWTLLATPNPSQGGGELNGVSCPSASVCIAVGNSNAGNLAEQWNGTGWTIQRTPNPRGAQFTFLNTVACTSASACIAAGAYVNAAGAAQTLAERWNGTSWAIQPTPGLAGGVMGQLIGVACTSASGCTAVGYSNPNPSEVNHSSPATLAERWNGRTWRVQHTPNLPGAASSTLNGVACTAPSACTAVGNTSNSRGTSLTLAQRWNGRTWSIQPTPSLPGTGLNAVSCVTESDCVAVGEGLPGAGALAERWNGKDWTVQPTPKPAAAQPAGLNAIWCTAASNCVAAGGYMDATGGIHVLTEQWNGHAWKLLPALTPSRQPQNVFLGVACPASAACIGVGTAFDASNNPTGTFAERWNGTSWTLQRTPTGHTPGGFLDGVWCASVTACIATGNTNAGTLAERLTGTTWTVLHTPNPPGTQGDFLNNVSCTSLSACTSVGLAFAPGGFPPQTLAERWNGMRWRIQPTPLIPGVFDISGPSVACPARSACIAVGGYANTTQQVTLAEQWHGAGQSGLLPRSGSVALGSSLAAWLRGLPLRAPQGWHRSCATASARPLLPVRGYCAGGAAAAGTAPARG